MTWMIYGANGYTGELVARLAVARGERPVLAGRNAAAVGALATSLALDAKVVDLANAKALREAVEQVDAVAHCAGPFVRTAKPMVDACLAAGTHYVDVTGEPEVFEAVLARDAEAAEAGITLLTGGGFDVVPTDCLAGLLAAELPDATSLEIAFRAGGGLSRGTALTGLDMATGGALRRVDGRLVRGPIGQPTREVAFPSRTRTVGAITWGDVVTAYHSTGIPNITVFGPVPKVTPAARLLRFGPFRALAARAIRRGAPGPSAQVRAATMVEIFASVRSESGSRTATLTGPNGYDITADAVVREIPLLASARPGAHTPATALGPDFVHSLDGVKVTLNP
ncbi:MAG TPA: saccharopine dehydrogenase NADP-binding domain-containing protein [Actinoplanes sp.]|jgi:saccharopine dehydrogenase (NAD+, L-lysine-forming)|nr:saccharopine dehydrogenase NADP-binding domain-containing protein [Actinoplanes sp.]